MITSKLRNHWVFGLCPSWSISKTREHSVLNLGQGDIYSVLFLERAVFNHWTEIIYWTQIHFRILVDGRSLKPVIPLLYVLLRLFVWKDVILVSPSMCRILASNYCLIDCRRWASWYGQLFSGEHGYQWSHVPRCFVCTECKDSHDVRSTTQNNWHDLVILFCAFLNPQPHFWHPLYGRVYVDWQLHYDLKQRISVKIIAWCHITDSSSTKAVYAQREWE
jgi:hypothetical protein